MNKTNRKFLVPEVVQTSGVDCGPAALKSLLEGMGITVSYGRLREACHTNVDGTSIDTLEEIAIQLGLDAEQILVPIEHLLLPDSTNLPAIVVIRRPDGLTHFVVVWRTHGNRFVQIMDPATGRRWLTIQQFLSNVYELSFPIPVTTWRAWAGSDDFLNPLRYRLSKLNIRQTTIEEMVSTATIDNSWRSLAILDAATRMVDGIIRADGLRRGQEATKILLNLIAPSTSYENIEETSIPEPYWMVCPTFPDTEGNEQLRMRGAILLLAHGTLEESLEKARVEVLNPELISAMIKVEPNSSLTLLKLIRIDGLFLPGAVIFATVLIALGIVIEALLLRRLIDAESSLTTTQRLNVLGTILGFSALLLLLRFYALKAILKIGRNLENHLRTAFLQKIPRLNDQYFRSRPISDLAQRSHAIHYLRNVPELGFKFLLIFFTLMFTALAVIWISPENTLPVILLSCLSIVAPLLYYPILAERDMRTRTHVGALSRFFLDSMLGLIPIRTHSAENAIRRRHESLLVKWREASNSFYLSTVTITGIQWLMGYSFAIWILYRHIQYGAGVETVLLLVFWLLTIPILAQDLVLLVRQYSISRNTTLRLLEPLGMPEDLLNTELASSAITSGSKGNYNSNDGVKIEMTDVSVHLAGHEVLHNICLSINANEHVAILGKSGAGKSTLASLLLGLHHPHTGNITVDDGSLNSAQLLQLREVTAWIDPTVHLWNRSFLENLNYGNSLSEDSQVTQIISQAELITILNKMPRGLHTSLGESGRLVSGGEGQRVRLARAMLRKDVRLVILDEPFRGLARSQRSRLLHKARQLWTHATLLYITHDISETKSFDKIFILENGNLVENGKPSTLINNPNSNYSALLRAESNVQHTVWSDTKWRKFRLENGQLINQQKKVK